MSDSHVSVADAFGTREEMIDRYLALKAENERLGKRLSETHAALDHLLHGATTVLMHIQPDEDHCEIVYLPGNELDALKYGIEQAEAVLGRNPHSSLPITGSGTQAEYEEQAGHEDATRQESNQY